MDREISYLRRPREMRRRASERDRRARRERHEHVARELPPSPHHKLIERGLNGDRCGSQLAARIAQLIRDMPAGRMAILRRTLHALDRLESPILNNPQELGAIGHLMGFGDKWIRRPWDWSLAASQAAGRMQLAELLRFVLCAYPVPRAFDWAWTSNEGRLSVRGREWFIHLGSGQSLRTAPGFPNSISRAAAGAVLRAPADLILPQALRWGEFIAAGCSEACALEAARTRLGRADANAGVAQAIAHFLGRTIGFPLSQIGPLVDYVWAQRLGVDGMAPRPRFNLNGRHVAGVLRDIHQWHGQLNRLRNTPVTRWESCGIAGMEQAVMNESGDAAIWRIVELTHSSDLLEEGKAMHHCVASYVWQASRGHCAIFSLRRREEADPKSENRIGTIEVDLPDRHVAQARGPCNAAMKADALDVIRRWATCAGLKIAAQWAAPL